MDAGENDIGSFARERQLVLEEHLNIVESGITEILNQHGKASSPGLPLTRTGALVGLNEHLFHEEIDKGVLDRRIPSYRRSVEMQESPQAARNSCGGGMFLRESPSSPL